MKKLISTILSLSLTAGLFTVPVSAATTYAEPTNGYYINASFDDGNNPFSTTSGGGSVEIVAAGAEGVGDSGSVLKISSGKSTTFSADAVFANPISIAKPLVFETKINFVKQTDVYKKLFTMSGGTNAGRNVGNGLAWNYKSSGVSTLSPSTYQNNTSSYFRDPQDDTKPFSVGVNTWYRLKVVFSGGNTMDSFEFADAEGNVLIKREGLKTANEAYPLPDIGKIGFATHAWSYDDVFYLDDVKVYELSDFTVADSFSGRVDAESSVIEVPFTKALNPDTLSGITITSTNAPAPEIEAVEAAGSVLKITLKDKLAYSSNYTINLSGLKPLDGNGDAPDSVNFKTTAAPAEGEEEEPIEDAYIYATFENGKNPFSTVSNGMTAEIVSAADEGMGDGSILKLTTGTSGLSEAAAVFANPIAQKKLVFETKFSFNGLLTYKKLFSLTAGTNTRNKSNGLAWMYRLGAPHYKAVLSPSTPETDLNSYFKDPSDETLPYFLANKTWYGIKIVFDGVDTINSLKLTDAEGNVIIERENLSTMNAGWPMPDIGKIAFVAKSWGQTEKIYLDDVKVYEYSAMSVLDSFNANIDADADVIEVPFNKALNPATLSKITVTSENAANPEIEKIEANGKVLKITFKNKLTASSEYTINLTGLEPADGTDLLTKSVNFTTGAAAIEGAYINASFDDGKNPFTTITGGGTVKIVDAETEGVGDTGKVLKLTTGKVPSGSTTFDAAAVFEEPIPVTNPLVFETKVRFAQDVTYKMLFTMTGGSNPGRNKSRGLAWFNRLGSPYYKAVLVPSSLENEGTSKYFTDPADSTKPYLLSKNTWYSIKIVFDGADTITSLKFFDEDGNLLLEGENLSTMNAGYPMPDIGKIGFGSKAWANEEIFYVDDVKVYEYKEAEALAFNSASIAEGATVSPAEVDSILLDFNNKINKASLKGVTATANGSAVDVTAELAGDSTDVLVKFTNGLPGGADIVVDYSAVKDDNGSSVSGSVSFKTESGVFVKGITFSGNEILAGKAVSGVVDVLNATSGANKVTVVATVYEKIDGGYKLIAVDADVDKEIPVGKSTLDAAVTVPADANVSKVKVQIMVLEDMASIIPLCTAATLGDDL